MEAERVTVSSARHDLRVLLALRRIVHAVDLHSRRLQAMHNITAPQLVCLLAIKEHNLLTTGSVARHIHLSPSTVIGILDRLESKGLVQRERDKMDRRLVYVSLTESGKTLAANAPSPLQDRLEEALSKLPDDEQETIAKSLERVVELMETQHHTGTAPVLETGPLDSSNKSTAPSI